MPSIIYIINRRTDYICYKQVSSFLYDDLRVSIYVNYFDYDYNSIVKDSIVVY